MRYLNNLSKLNLKKLGLFLKAMRLKLAEETNTPSQYSQEMVAVNIGCTRQTVVRVELGLVEPRIGLFLAMVNYYEMSDADIVKILRIVEENHEEIP